MVVAPHAEQEQEMSQVELEQVIIVIILLQCKMFIAELDKLDAMPILFIINSAVSNARNRIPSLIIVVRTVDIPRIIVPNSERLKKATRRLVTLCTYNRAVTLT